MLFGNYFDQKVLDINGVQIKLRQGGSGSPLLLLHGYPQTHIMWHKVAPRLTANYRVVCPDLRGYGDSSKPPSDQDHSTYSKRVMAQDMIELMAFLGYSEFFVAGHDRGARVAHRMALDYPARISKACVMDIAPTHHMFKTTDQNFATAYYHWFFLIQPDGLPEHLIGADPAYYLTEKLRRWSAPGTEFDNEAVSEYIRCFSNPETIHASCEDYRAAASIDLRHDEEDMHKKVSCPLLVLWGTKGFVHRTYDVLAVWRERAEKVEGNGLNCGHFLPEEVPVQVTEELQRFFANN
ncbi:alpha/beta fold hydrolase [Desulfosediminicola flagellatus]|uniref:alpha/beta fold hydrolase n=1 Tax=Desulfosediminicola flagellatus TaxID=2569541 RepID=UPI0010AC3235|nr:alpha/beta hydrolase [Desulfosediminicola flagellatus]